MFGFQVFIERHHLDYIGYFLLGTDQFEANVFEFIMKWQKLFCFSRLRNTTELYILHNIHVIYVKTKIWRFKFYHALLRTRELSGLTNWTMPSVVQFHKDLAFLSRRPPSDDHRQLSVESFLPGVLFHWPPSKGYSVIWWNIKIIYGTCFKMPLSRDSNAQIQFTVSAVESHDQQLGESTKIK